MPSVYYAVMLWCYDLTLLQLVRSKFSNILCPMNEVSYLNIMNDQCILSMEFYLLADMGIFQDDKARIEWVQIVKFHFYSQEVSAQWFNSLVINIGSSGILTASLVVCVLTLAWKIMKRTPEGS